MNKVALYARVSTDDKEQNPETQLFALRQFCRDAGWEIYREYVDTARAKDYSRRKAWQQLQSDARQRKFKTVLVFRLDRAFRDAKECINCISDWSDRGITFKSMSQDVIDTTTSHGKFIQQIMAAMAELESAVTGDRVRAGMARAKAEGRPIGRKRYAIPLQTICKGLTSSMGDDGGPNFSATARYLSKETGKNISAGFLSLRLSREAEARGIDRKELIEEILHG